MLLYRPLIAAYRHTPHAGLKRFLLRELANPVLHAEAQEVLAELPSASGSAEVLAAIVSLAERALTLRLTTRDPDRSLGGLWTCQAAGRALVDRVRASVAAPVLLHAGGALLAPAVTRALAQADGRARSLVVAALGCCGPSAGLNALADELIQGRTPGAAAVGLALARPADADTILFRAVQARGLGPTAGWIGTALAAVASADTLPLVRRLVASQEEALVEQAALALEAFAPDEAREALDGFPAEPSPLVRLHLAASLGRLGLPGGLATLARLERPGDAEILRVTALRACAGSRDPAVVDRVRAALARPGVERSVALEVLVSQGVRGAEVTAAAREAAAARGGRDLLVGLIALAVLEPDEALARCRALLAGPSLDEWYLAAYALRYLGRPQVVPLLVRVLDAAQGTPLAEIAAGALARHLEHPDVVPRLLAELSREPDEATARRILEDLARHLPESLVPDAAAGLRELLDRAPATPVLGPALEALGALGHATDLPRLVEATRGPAGEHAIRALELLMDPDALPVLAPISEGRDELAQAARLARVRLGDVSAVSELSNRASTPETLVLGLGLTLRCVPAVSRLALLHRALVRGGAGKSLSQRVALADAPRPAAPVGLDQALWRAPAVAPAPEGHPAAAPTAPLALPRGQRRDASGRPALYVELGRAWLGQGVDEASTLPRVLALAALVFAVGLLMRGPARPPAPAPAPTARPVAPPVLTTGSGPVAVGAVVAGAPDAPVALATRLPENRLLVTGRVRLAAAEEVPDNPRNVRLRFELQEGEMLVDFPRGRTSVAVEAAATSVEVQNGRVLVGLAAGELVVTVYQGRARVGREGGEPTELRSGQRGHFREGRPTRPVEAPESLRRPPFVSDSQK